MVLPAFVGTRPNVRLAVAFVAAMIVASLVRDPSTIYRLMWGWNAGVATLVALLILAMRQADAGHVREIAQRDDPSRFLVFAIVIVATAGSLFGVIPLLAHARELPTGARLGTQGLALGTVFGSWTLLHAVWTFRYAHLFYAQKEAGVKAPLVFPGDEEPDYTDFAYFSFCLGMCFQTSDVAVGCRRIRQEVTIHTLFSFVFNFCILASTINLLSGLLG